MDHAALKALLATKDPKGRIAWCITEIWNYEFEICHRKEKNNTDADALSRIKWENSGGNPNSIVKIESQHLAQEITPQELKLAQENDPFITSYCHKNSQKEGKWVEKNGIKWIEVGGNKTECYQVIMVPQVLVNRFLKIVHDEI